MTAEAWTTEQRVAVALAYELGLDWARWARGETAPGRESWCATCGRSPAHEPREPCWFPCAEQPPEPTPVPDPLGVEAYRADCARRGVEPGPLPSLHYVDALVRWCRREVNVLSLAVGSAHAAMVDVRIVFLGNRYGSVDARDLALLARLCKAAKGAMR